MPIPTFIRAAWSLISGMKDNLESRMKWAEDKLKQGQMIGLRGSVTIHFSEGVPMSCVIQMNDKPSLDESIDKQ